MAELDEFVPQVLAASESESSPGSPLVQQRNVRNNSDLTRTRS
eukprot:CAMPEP_0176423874 /NCGR_PEP_ID=MMETSP0127-20121128/10528_1 /TAXON_ID=938130 /ORGANISM="Platyophrya macrostoma, Strain WH" /LENGTH=42 /DNA_ID= /DNA_START= /DNA_END= /DNA_ORIENTATION=